MTSAARWALVAGALVLAVIVAVLPRGGSDDAGEQDPSLAAARAEAKLPPCPRPSGGSAGSGALTGVRSVCLGDGEPVDVGGALAGRTTLINVWATWCAPCREELPVLARYARSRGAAGVLLVQVASGETGGLHLLAELGVRLPSLHDGTGATGPVRSALRVPNSLPASYVVHPDGTVRFVRKPRVFADVEQVRTAVTEYGGKA